MAQAENAVAGHREGARWINVPPSSEEFGQWFRENVVLHDGMEHEKYVGGMVLIPAEENQKLVTGVNRNTGGAIIEERERLTFVPYPKVETRVTYFWDLLAKRSDDWRGVIEPVPPVDRPDTGGALGALNRMLPEGFFVMPVPVGDGFSNFLCCSMRVAIIDRKSGETIVEGRGTKQVALTRRGRQGPYADQNTIMKAETGALGRALGMAGIFTVPGSGVATAEDMLESMTQASAAAEAPARQEAPLPPAAPSRTDGPAEAPAGPQEPPLRTAAEQTEDERTALVSRARELVTEAGQDFPDALEQFRTWMSERKPPISGNLGALKTPELRGVVKKLEKLLTEARDAQAARLADEPEPEAEAS